MTDSYQAIYDAVRSRISNGDVGHAISEVARYSFDISHAVDMVRNDFQITAMDMRRPSVLYKPDLYPDGNQWCALLGKDLQVGVAGFGDTPAAAMLAFDAAWYNEKTPEATVSERTAAKIAEEEAREQEIANGQFGVGA